MGWVLTWVYIQLERVMNCRAPGGGIGACRHVSRIWHTAGAMSRPSPPLPGTRMRSRVPTRPFGYDLEQEATRREEVTQKSGGLREGRQMQNFELPDQEGRPFNLHQRLQEESLVLVFYRGDW